VISVSFPSFCLSYTFCYLLLPICACYILDAIGVCVCVCVCVCILDAIAICYMLASGMLDSLTKADARVCVHVCVEVIGSRHTHNTQHTHTHTHTHSGDSTKRLLETVKRPSKLPQVFLIVVLT
jgi:hypothetical protein